MKKAEKFLIQSSSIVFLIFLALFIMYFLLIIPERLFLPVLLGGGIATIYFILGLVSIKFGLNGSKESFFKVVLGGMVFRLLLMLTIVLISLKFLDISRNNLIFSILFFYILYLTIEIIYLFNKKI